MGNVFDSFDIVGDIFSIDSIASGDGLEEIPLVIDKFDADAINFWF